MSAADAVAGHRGDDQSLLATAVFDWCLRRAEREARSGRADNAARWCAVAASSAHTSDYPYLCSPALESLLVRLAPRGSFQRHRPVAPPRWLHVFSASYSIGGHTALARRWITMNPTGHRHDLVVTRQRADDVEAGLRAAVEATGGTVTSTTTLDPIASARVVRERACGAVAVALHIHPDDVGAVMAFAHDGGPPVVFVNHQDHAFWIGVGCADVIADIRASGMALTQRYRDGARGSQLPIPLIDQGIRRRIASGRKPDEVVLLTVGSEHKYRPTTSLDFMQVVGDVLRTLPRAHLYAVGPGAADPGWRDLCDSFPGRVHPVGIQRDLSPWLSKADLYIEGFPIGSYTALLEAALSGLPVVRKPYLAAPDDLPLDQGALSHIPVADSPSAYLALVLALAADADRRRAEGDANRAAALTQHCGEGWGGRLLALLRQAPNEHATNPPRRSQSLEGTFRRYRLSLSRQPGDDVFKRAFLEAHVAGLRPLVDRQMLRAIAQAADFSRVSYRPGKVLAGSVLMSLLPARIGAWAYRHAPW